LEDNKAVHLEWRKLVVVYSVSGAQVHDARLVAAMHVHHVAQYLFDETPSVRERPGAGQLLTFNVRDFLRYSGIKPVHPQIVAQRA
jgi:hypothetical protein